MMMNNTVKLKYSSLSLAILSVMLSDMVHSATNFNITPVLPLPTNNSVAGTVSANFILTNSTHSARNGYRFVDLPSNVVQVVNTNLCQNPINLATGASCVLQLDITGLISNPKITLCKGTSCTTLCLPLNIVLQDSGLLVAVGSSSYPNLGGVPVLSQSTDSGQTWSYPTLPALPLAGVTGLLNAARCVGTSCIVVGEEDASTPLIAVTHDNGQTWQYASVPTPANNAGLYSVSNVSENTFVAVGQIDASPTSGYILRSTDGGLSWSLPASYTPVAGSFRSVSCSGNTCVATGTTGSSSNLSPLVLEVSQDGGQTWINKSNTPNLPSTSNLYAASCNTNSCVVVGEDLGYLPLVMESTDNGANWNVVSLSNIYEGGLHTVECTDAVCVAGGFANTTDTPTSDVKPVIVQSINNAAWSTTYLTPPTNNPRYGFHSIDCNSERCVAAGDDNNYASYEAPPSPPFIGIVAQATHANNWTWSNFESLPPSVTNSVYNSASCGSVICFAVGQNEDPTPNTPLIVQSLTTSASWLYASLPTNTGGFIGSGAAQ